MLEIFFEHYKSSLKILLIFYIYFLIVIYIFYGQIKEHLLSNWKYYREHPLILPISGFIKKDEGLGAVKTTVNNFIRVLTKIITKFLNIFMKPIYPVLEIIIKALNTIKNVLEGMRKQINVMRNFMFKLFEKMYIRLQNGVAAITYFFLKLREGLKRSFGLFTLMIYSVEHSYMFFESLVRSPMGKFGKFAADCLADDAPKDGCGELYREIAAVEKERNLMSQKYGSQNNTILRDFNSSRMKQIANDHYNSYK